MESSDEDDQSEAMDLDAREDALNTAPARSNSLLNFPNHPLRIDTRVAQSTSSVGPSNRGSEQLDALTWSTNAPFDPMYAPSTPAHPGGHPYFAHPANMYAAPPTPASSNASIPPSPRHLGTPLFPYPPSPLVYLPPPFGSPGLPSFQPRLTAVELSFLQHPRDGGLFADISLSGDSNIPNWWLQEGVSSSDQLLVAWRSLKRAGFQSLGDFLQVLSTSDLSQCQPVLQGMSAFLQQKSRSGTRPVDIVKLWFQHQQSENWDDHKPVPPSFSSLPPYAKGPNERYGDDALGRTLSTNSTKANLLEWALQVVMSRVDQEATRLLSMDGEFTIQEHLTWDMLLGFDVKLQEVLIAKEAPVTYALLSTLAVGPTARRKLSKAIADGTRLEPSEDEGEDDTETQDEPHDTSQPAFSTTGDSDSPVSNHNDSRAANPAHQPLRCEAERLKLRRDPWLGVVVCLLMLLNFRYRYATLFPTTIGILLFIFRANHNIFAFMSRIGLSVAQSTVIEKLRQLGADSQRLVRSWVQASKNDPFPAQIIFDNINKMSRACQPSLGHHDILQNGTTSILIKLVDVPKGALDHTPVDEKARASLTIADLTNDIDWAHLRGIGRGTILRIMLKHIPSLRSHRASVEKLFTVDYAKHRLTLRKSEIHSLRCSSIDESTTVGTMQVIEDIVHKQLGISDECLERHDIIAGGDQLSKDRLRKGKRMSGKGRTPGQKKKYLRDKLEWWHTKYNWGKGILRLNWWPTLGRSVFGLHHDCKLLGRKINPNNVEFYPMHRLLEVRFEALVLDALRLVCEERTGKISDASTLLTDALSAYFQPGEVFAECTFETLVGLADTIYTRYMRNRASEDCESHTTWTEDIYGKSAQGNDFEITDRNGGELPSSQSANVQPGVRLEHTPESTRWDGDRVLLNNINYLRQVSWYLELCAAISEGDMGRVWEIAKVLRFSFWGAGCTNYGNEFLEMACQHLKEFKHDLHIAMLNNWLVNPSGLPGHWHECDLLLEHYNFWIKVLYNAKSLNFDSEFLRECVSLNLRGFNELRDRLDHLFSIAKAGGRHTNAKITADINRLGAHYRADAVLTFHRSRDQPYAVSNEFMVGLDKLQNGQLATFLERTTRNPTFVIDEEEDEDEADTSSHADEGPGRLPGSPIIMNEGVSRVREFDTGGFDVQ